MLGISSTSPVAENQNFMTGCYAYGDPVSSVLNEINVVLNETVFNFYAFLKCVKDNVFHCLLCHQFFNLFYQVLAIMTQGVCLLLLLQRLFGWEDEETRDLTGSLGSLFPVVPDQGTDTIRPFHKSIIDWLDDKIAAKGYYISIQEGHRLLAKWGFARFQEDPKRLPAYLLRHLSPTTDFRRNRARKGPTQPESSGLGPEAAMLTESSARQS